MTVLRSRVISSPQEPPLNSSGNSSSPSNNNDKTLKEGPTLEPSTPAKITEPLSPSSSNNNNLSAPPRRRSLRLSSNTDDFTPTPKRPRGGGVSGKVENNVDNDSPSRRRVVDSKVKKNVRASYCDGIDIAGLIEKLSAEVQDELQGYTESKQNEYLSLRSGTKVIKRVEDAKEEKRQGKVVLIGGKNDGGNEGRMEENVSGFSRNNKRLKSSSKGKGVLLEGEDGNEAKLEEEFSGFNRGDKKLRSPKRFSREEKGKSTLSDDDDDDDDFLSNESDMEEGVRSKKKLRSPRRFSREEKGKGKVSDDVVLDDCGSDELNLEPGLDLLDVGLNLDTRGDEGIDMGGLMDVVEPDGIDIPENVDLQEGNSRRDRLMGRFKDIARRNASKYAHFSGQEEENQAGLEAEEEVPSAQWPEKVEDWPGPFSTALKIIRDREKNLSGLVQKSGSVKDRTPLVSWTPKKDKGPEWKKRAVPSLQSLCLKILAVNVDAISSLNYVPDVLRHKLCQMLCDSRRMNAHFFSLLLEGSPSEIRVTDCSWLEEEEFERSLEACDTSNLTVLQLDLCGHCISDSSLLKALVPKRLPALTAISLKGACRISDEGLSGLLSAAPALRSMNLSQCSLLTDVGIKSIADLLGPILQELYLDDCDTLDAMRILPILKRLERLEVLSLRGIGGVSDKFIKNLMNSKGQNLKELVLANCVNLTDSSLKAIAESCPHLCVLDLTHIRKLTDIGMAHLANGCRGIQDLKLCRNAFSDDGIAAFLETCGACLTELSLNNVTKVGQNTTLSLARRCKNLESLDLSWCRSLTDEALGLIADSCLSLRLLKIFGCTQITKTFSDGHSNPNLQVIGMRLTPILEHIKRPDFQQGPLHYSAVPPL